MIYCIGKRFADIIALDGLVGDLYVKRTYKLPIERL